MASGQGEHLIQCPNCGAWMGRADKACWLCRNELAGDSVTPPAGAAPRPAALAGGVSRPMTPQQFGLSTLLLLMTLVCIGFGVYDAAPGLIVPFLLVVAPALARMMAAGRVASKKGESLSFVGLAGHFFVGLSLVLFAWIGAGIALVGACTVMLMGLGSGSVDSPGRLILYSGLAAIVAFVALLAFTWPRSR